jgi:VCBS repeat-containing protein
LGDRVLRPGDILTESQISQLTFAPARTETDAAASISYLPIFEDSVAREAVMTIGIRGKEDKAPVAEDSAGETYKNLPLEGKLKVKEPENQAMTFSVVRQPKRGTVSIRPDGTFTYTPKKNKVGTDSFTFTATDPAGKVSREATVTIEILKPDKATTQYTDTIGNDCRFAAEWMKNTGLFVGEQVDGQIRFQPDKAVSRGEFLTMLVKTLDIPMDANTEKTGFTDEVPGWLKPYLAAALRAGVTVGWPEQETFGAEQSITGAEAALLLQNGLGLPVIDVSNKENGSELPAWAEEALMATAAEGFELEADAHLTRGEAAKILYQVSKMAAAGDLY